MPVELTSKFPGYEWVEVLRGDTPAEIAWNILDDWETYGKYPTWMSQRWVSFVRDDVRRLPT